MQTKTYIIDKEKYSESVVQDFLEKNKKYAKFVENIFLFENSNLLFFRDNVLQHQNTKRENYPTIIKSFFKDLNKTVELLIKSILEIQNNPELKCIIVKEPLLIGHKIEIEENLVASVSARDLYDKFYQELYLNIKIVVSLIHRMLNGCNSDSDKTLVFISDTHPQNTENKELQKAYDYLSKKLKNPIAVNVHPLFIRDSLYKVKDMLFKAAVSEEERLALEYIISNKQIMHYLYHSCNLVDEKILKKKEVIYPLWNNDLKYSFVAKDAGSVKSRSLSLLGEWKVDFSMEYYLKKYIIESVSKKDFLSFMCTTKDFLSRDYIEIEPDSFSKKHPFVKQSEEKSNFLNSIYKLKDAYKNAIDIYNENITASLQQSYSLDEIKKIFKVTKIFYGYKQNTMVHYNKDEIKPLIKDALFFMGEKILNRSIDESTNKFTNAIFEEYNVHIMLQNILEYMYQDVDIEASLTANNKLFHNRTTFHTTLLDSLVFDFRKNSEYPDGFNDEVKKRIQDDNSLKVLAQSIKEHPYHDYVEIDKDFIDGKKSVTTIAEILSFIQQTSELKFSMEYKSSLKFRKLMNYKASGIYFSHTKTMGIDIRQSFESYIHEMIHHIDLSSYNNGRQALIKFLQKYFMYRITHKKDYFMKDEELIARAGEIAVVLYLSGYDSSKVLHLQNSNNPQHLSEYISFLKSNYEKTIESNFMKSWGIYNHSEEYLSIEAALTEKNFNILDMLIGFFGSFVGKRSILPPFLKEENVNHSSNHLNSYSKSHYSYTYQLCDIYKISQPVISNLTYLRYLFSEVEIDEQA